MSPDYALGYALEKLGDAIRVLATHVGTIQERVVAAAEPLQAAQVHKGLPDDVKDEMQSLFQDMVRAGSASDAEAQSLTERVRSLNAKVETLFRP